MKKTAHLFVLLAFSPVIVTNDQPKMPWYKSIFFGSGSAKTTLSTMNYEQLCEGKKKALENKDRMVAIKYLERMAKLCPDAQGLRLILLELADLLFEEGKYAKAILLYDQYTKSYPGNNADYVRAYYQKIVCSFYQMLDFDRDQTITEQTIELCDQFLHACKSSRYDQEVRTMVVSCKQRLAENELSIAHHYMISSDAVAANKRLARVRETYLTVPDVEQKLLLAEIELAQMVGNATFAQAKKTELIEKYPQNPTVVAQLKKPVRMANRF